MKQALLLTFTLSTLTLLASCSNQDAPSSDATTTPPAVTTPEVTPEVDVTPEVTPEVDVAPEGDMAPDTSEVYTSSELSLSFADAIWESRDEEANQYMPIMTSPEDPNGEFIYPMLNFTPEDAEGFAISVSGMMVQAYGIAVIKPVEGKEEAIKESLQSFIDLQVQNFTNYLADQLEVAQSARLETLEDGTIVLVLCADQDTVFDSIVANLA